MVCMMVYRFERDHTTRYLFVFCRLVFSLKFESYLQFSKWSSISFRRKKKKKGNPKADAPYVQQFEKQRENNK